MFSPIGVASSCYREKFGIPRQAGLVPAARGEIELHGPVGGLTRNEALEATRGLEDFSHLWVVFVFHGVSDQESKSKTLVRPPRLGGDRKTGVLATRSPHRPNPIGLSCVRLDAVRASDRRVWLEVSGIDWLDGTPILDIKPYLPYADSIPEARAGWAQTEPEAPLVVSYSELASRQITEKERSPGGYPGLRQLIEQTLRLDPRPAFQARGDDGGSESQYAALILDFDLHWEIGDGRCRVLELRDRRRDPLSS